MLSITPEILEKCYQFGIEAYPEEACGMISGSKSDRIALDAIHPMKNMMNLYHEQDPERFPRTNKNAYMIDPLEQMKLERALKKQGQCIKVIYHSHPDVGAYFSDKDRADALWEGEPRFPGVHFLVCGIKDKKRDGAILVSFNDETKDFDITPLD